MSRLNSKTLAQIEKLLQSKSYSEVIRQLDEIRHSITDREDYAYCCILHTEAAIHLGDYSNTLIDQAIDALRSTRHVSNYARAKFLKGWLLALTGQFWDAKEPFLESYAHYLRCQDINGIARTLNWLSYVALKTGDARSAIENLTRAIDVTLKGGDERAAAKIAHNLAHAHYGRGEIGKSLSLYRRFAVSRRVHGLKPFLNYCYMSALPLALLGHINEARNSLTLCKPYLHNYIRENAIYFENVGLISILAGDFCE
ncbi:MAG: tetratricopeptide repeat protein, partial [Candidatus Zixiibacteriota bacterium]